MCCVLVLTPQQTRSIIAAGAEAKVILAEAIDAQVEHLTLQLKQANDALLGGESETIAAFLQAQLQQATAAAEAPPAEAPPCLPQSQSALALAAAYMTSEATALSAAVQFGPVDKDHYRMSVLQMLPPLGCMQAPLPSSPPQFRDCDMTLPPLGHFDFSQFSSPSPFDFGGIDKALACRVEGGDAKSVSSAAADGPLPSKALVSVKQRLQRAASSIQRAAAETLNGQAEPFAFASLPLAGHREISNRSVDLKAAFASNQRSGSDGSSVFSSIGSIPCPAPSTSSSLLGPFGGSGSLLGSAACGPFIPRNTPILPSNAHAPLPHYHDAVIGRQQSSHSRQPLRQNSPPPP